jgi:hypothetical protein
VFVSADILIGKDTIKYGKITRIDRDIVFIAEGCEMERVKSLPLDTIRVIKFNGECTIPNNIPPIGGLSSDACPDQPNEIVYVVSFGREGRVYAAGIDLDANGNLTINIVNKKGKLRGPVTKVRLISRISTCRKYIPTTFKWPKEFVKS